MTRICVFRPIPTTANAFGDHQACQDMHRSMPGNASHASAFQAYQDMHRMEEHASHVGILGMHRILSHARYNPALHWGKPSAGGRVLTV